jgi:hypothetical protein
LNGCIIAKLLSAEMRSVAGASLLLLRGSGMRALRESQRHPEEDKYQGQDQF